MPRAENTAVLPSESVDPSLPLKQEPTFMFLAGLLLGIITGEVLACGVIWFGR